MAATEPHVGQHVRSHLKTRYSISQGEDKMKYRRLIMLILVAVAVGLMISTYLSLPAYAAKSRHISPYSALCSVVNRAGSTIRGHICMNILSYVSVQYILVYSCACVVVQVDLHNATVRTAKHGILLPKSHKSAKTRQPCMATLGITARHKTCVIAPKRIMP